MIEDIYVYVLVIPYLMTFNLAKYYMNITQYHRFAEISGLPHDTRLIDTN